METLIERLRAIAAEPPRRHVADPLRDHVMVVQAELEQFLAAHAWQDAAAAAEARGRLLPLAAAPQVSVGDDAPALTEEEATVFISRTIKARTLAFRANIAALIAVIQEVA